MSCSSYSDYYSEYDDESLSEPESVHKRKKDKKRKKEKKLRKRDKKLKKRERKEKKRGKPERRPDRKRRRSDSRDASDSRRDGGDDKRRRVGGDDPRMGWRYGYEPHRRENSRSRGLPPMPALPMGFPMPTCSFGGQNGSRMSLAEVCDAAGRGKTTGETAVDNEVSVYAPNREKVDKPDVFEEFSEIKAFPRDLRSALKAAGFPGPSQIQAYTWPLGLRGKDVIGIAATGSGKTLAFLLPAFTAMLDEGWRPERDGVGLLVLSPTRELAQQIEAETDRFGRVCNMRCVAMYGGQPKGPQLSKYKGGVHSIIACPGRLNDYLEGGQVRVDNVLKLVLDEADRMLDMGFEPQIRKILDKVPRKRHTLFFTATWPKEVRRLADEILHKPYKVMIGNRDELKGNQDIIQVVRIVDSYKKNESIMALLNEAGLGNRHGAGKCLVFCNTKRMCDQLAHYISNFGVACTSIHGDKDQGQRDDALNGLKNGRIKVLVATDVAARGLDIKGVGLVVNFDPANNTEDYVHRIGRTGRAGAKGYAVTLLTHSDAPKARGIVEVMERTDQHVEAELRDLAGSAGSGGRSRGGKGGGKRNGP